MQIVSPSGSLKMTCLDFRGGANGGNELVIGARAGVGAGAGTGIGIGAAFDGSASARSSLSGTSSTFGIEGPFCVDFGPIAGSDGISVGGGPSAAAV